jgi:hypothetical protein
MSAIVSPVTHFGETRIGGDATSLSERRSCSATATVTAAIELCRIMARSRRDQLGVPVAAPIPDPYDTSNAVSAAHAGALQMASRGLSVFLLHGVIGGKCTCGDASCKSPGKHPRRQLSFKEATTNPTVIKLWFKSDPNLNYGVRLGVEVGGTGKMLVVIDVDSYKPDASDALDALEALHGRLPETAEVVSGAGGRHCYYWTDSSLTFTDTMGKNIDLKVNGYVVGPGSLHASGQRYDWEGSSNPFEGQEISDLPQWVADKFSKAKGGAGNVETAANAVPLLEYEVRSIKHDLSHIPASCGRTEWLHVLMALHDHNQSLSMFQIADEWSQTCPEKYDAAAVIKAWNSFKLGGGISYETIRRLGTNARIAGIDICKLLENEQRTRAVEAMTVPGSQQAADVVEPPPARYKLLTASDLANAPSLQWMIRGLFPRTGLVALYGPSGTGKSFLALDLAATVAGGATEWYGMRVKNCPVTYCVLEGEGGMGKRAKAWAQHHGKLLPDELRFVTQPINLQQPLDIQDLADAIIKAGGAGGLVILDTLSRAAPEADENSSKDMGAIIAAAKALQGLTGGLVMLVHHTGKNSELGMRGHSSLFAAMDSVISVSKIQWEVKKSKDDATGTQHQFKLETLVLGVDDEGDEVTSCVAVPSTAAFALRQSKKLGPHQVVALETVKAMGSDFMSGVHHDQAVAAVAEKLDVDNKHKRERAKAAIGALIDMGKLSYENNYLRPA